MSEDNPEITIHPKAAILIKQLKNYKWDDNKISRALERQDNLFMMSCALKYAKDIQNDAQS